MRSLPAVVGCLWAAHAARAFYLPGSAPREYDSGESVPLLVNALTPQLSRQAELRSVVNVDYYHPRFHHCEPEGGPVSQRESLGSILFGDRLYSSPFDIRMMENKTCQTLCQATVPADDAKFINEAIRNQMALNWIVDGLPAAEMKKDDTTGTIFYSVGFALGDSESVPVPALHNHYNLYLEYHIRNGKYRVVGAVVWPASINSDRLGQAAPACDESSGSLQLSETKESKVHYTYSVIWRESKTPWATRWDHYLHVFDPRIHWFSLINSVVIAFFLAIMVGMILIRTVARDVGRFNAIDLAEDVQEDYGWKLVHGEVFRPPERSMLLSVIVGTGAQLTAMCSVTLVFALLGFLSPANRGSLSTAMIVMWTMFSAIAGYTSTLTYSTLDGGDWKKNALLTATLFPSLMFAILLFLNLFLLVSGSSGAVPFGTMLAIVAMWFLISLPLTLVGSYLALRRGPLSVPVRVNQIPRQIPPPSTWYLKPWPSAIMAGVLPFGAGFIECYFLLSSFFASKTYAAIGFLFLTFIVVALTTATTAVLICYFHLSQEDYRWQWRSFLTGGASAFYVLFYGLAFGVSRLKLGSWVSQLLYVSYLGLISLWVFLVFGSIGFLSALFFVRKVYAQVRID